ncbi:hypothetical protein MCOR25_003499 [Pyricularia grisea]|nr:hypothetical protein MCOR25_003499 [Pyricularia grisea]
MSPPGLDQVIAWHICTYTAFCFVVARTSIRLQRVKNLRADDGFIILALLCLVGDLVIQHYMWTQGLADPANSTFENFVNIMKMIVPGSTLYITSLWAIKAALVLLYKRIAGPRSSMQIVCNVALGVLAATWLLIFFHIMFQCWPHDRRWSEDPNYQCDPHNSEINYWITVIINITTDVAIISLPISIVAGLQMKLRKKIGVGAIFMLGIFVIIGSIIRAYFSKRNETMLTCTVSMIETMIAIIAACLPPLLSILSQKLSTKKTGYSPEQHQSHELSSRLTTHTQRSAYSTTRIEATTPKFLQQQKNNHLKGGDSEDELVGGVGAPHTSWLSTKAELGGIHVTKTVETWRDGP